MKHRVLVLDINGQTLMNTQADSGTIQRIMCSRARSEWQSIEVFDRFTDRHIVTFTVFTPYAVVREFFENLPK